MLFTNFDGAVFFFYFETPDVLGAEEGPAKYEVLRSFLGRLGRTIRITS